MSKQSWFNVDKEGLRELVASKPAWMAVAELLQNAWDEDSTTVHVLLEKIPGRPAARLIVEDNNPEGFKDLTHAFTLFARSEKRGDPTKRGRFNLGEKLVLARCIYATITTTKGTVIFGKDGKRRRGRKKLSEGTTFFGELRMNQAEFDETCEAVHMLQPPMPTYFNGKKLKTRPEVDSFETRLSTVVADEEGVLKDTVRLTEIRLYRVRPGETAHIYEMGIPVVATGDTYHVDVQQKVPLNMDRDNVTPGFLRKLRAQVLNHCVDFTSGDSLAEKWVDNALEDPLVDGDAVRHVITSRYGSKVCSYDPSDKEANNKAVAKGYTLVHGRSLSAQQWKTVKAAEALKPAGQVFPTQRVEYSPEGTPEKLVPEEKWTKEMCEVVGLAHDVSIELGLIIDVVLVNDESHGAATNIRMQAWYGSRRLHFNYRNLGKKWFRRSNREEHLRLIIHELAHEYESNHLDAEFHRACCRIGAKVALALSKGRMVL
jgi:hypothetical protein